MSKIKKKSKKAYNIAFDRALVRAARADELAKRPAGNNPGRVVFGAALWGLLLGGGLQPRASASVGFAGLETPPTRLEFCWGGAGGLCAAASAAAASKLWKKPVLGFHGLGNRTALPSGNSRASRNSRSRFLRRAPAELGAQPGYSVAVFLAPLPPGSGWLVWRRAEPTRPTFCDNPCLPRRNCERSRVVPRLTLLGALVFPPLRLCAFRLSFATLRLPPFRLCVFCLTWRLCVETLPS
jgi:hypothetical protein